MVTRTACAVIACLLAIGPREAAAQAYVPPAGEGTVSASYQYIGTNGQLGIDGLVFPENPPDKTRNHALIWHVEYGLSDKIAVHASRFVVA